MINFYHKKMKAILIILLIAIASSDFPEDLIKIAKCLLQSETLRGLIPKVIEAIITGDYLSLVSAVIQSFPKIKAEVLECLADEPILKASIKCLRNCVHKCLSEGNTNAYCGVYCLDHCRGT